ncbi:MAG: DUF167 domain-containing protein [Patescibacteria group bacterium]
MYLHVKVTPESKKEKLVVKSKTKLEVAVAAPAKRNLANERVKELVAGHYGLKSNQVRLVSGHHSPSKIFSLPD